MKCTCCGKEVDVDVNDVPPKWYGRYQASVLTDVICAECLLTAKGREVWNDKA